MSVSLNSSIHEITANIGRLCPNIKPSIFPSFYVPKTLHDLVLERSSSNGRLISLIADLEKEAVLCSANVIFCTEVLGGERIVNITDIQVGMILTIPFFLQN